VTRKDPERIRVLHAGPSRDSRGGMAAVLRDLAQSPLAERCDFRFVETWREGRRRHEGLVDFAVALVRIAVWSRHRERGIIHVHAAVRGSWYRKSIVVALARLLRRPVVLQIHSGAGDIRAFWARLGAVRRRLIRTAFAHADQVLSVSAAGGEALRDCLGLDEVLLVRNAAPEPKEPSGVAGDRRDVHVLYLGGFANPAKGGQVLMHALPAIVSADVPVSVSLAGPGEPPPQAVELARSDDRVRWVGWLDEEAKAAALAGADIVVFPSISEGLPVALLEAMSAGCSVIAARTGGMPEVLTDDVDAVLVDPADSRALADAIRALSADAPRRVRLGAAAAARAARLNRDEVYRPLLDLYNELDADANGETRSTAKGAGRRLVGRRLVPTRVGRSDPARALLVCSPGGHLQQMLALKPAWEPLDVSWATLPGRDVEHILAGERVALGHGPTNRSLPNLLRNIVFARRLLRRLRPDVIVSTGAGLAVPFFVMGRLAGARLVYVESLTRREGLSLSGRLVSPLAHEVFVQWPHAVSGRARYVGNLFSETVDASGEPGVANVGSARGDARPDPAVAVPPAELVGAGSALGPDPR
jgi:glycosyltransferase involved in cell wall biosynthesis